jgi:hypothetical protein
MLRRSSWQLCATLAVLLALARPAFAGGWVVVTLDSLPSSIQAGQAIRLGFMVRQHGMTPINHNPWENTPLAPFLSAKHSATGETIQANARQDGPLGHFVVDVSFPSAGAWEVEITPPPFASTKLGVFSVVERSQAAVATILTDRPQWVWWSMLLLLVALLLTAFVQRRSLTRLLKGPTGSAALPAEERQSAHSRLS